MSWVELNYSTSITVIHVIYPEHIYYSPFIFGDGIVPFIVFADSLSSFVVEDNPLASFGRDFLYALLGVPYSSCGRYPS